MTVRQLWENSLIEINKVQAPSLLLEDFNYFINKAVINYVNRRYAVYEETQQVIDDLRVLTANTNITSLTKVTGNKLQGATYVGVLPQDYFHMLGCVVEFTTTIDTKCHTSSDPIYLGARRMTAGMYSQIINNYYLKPSAKNPYYYIYNSTAPTIEVNADNSGVSDHTYIDGIRDGNTSPVNIEVRYGKDNSLYVLTAIHVDYLKVPRYMLLTQNQIDVTEDLSSVIEFPDYVTHEIIKELVALLLENASDPRLNTNIPINKTIPEQTQQAAQRR